MRALAITVVAACGSSAPAPAISERAPATPPPTPIAIVPADLHRFAVDPASTFVVEFERGDWSVAEVKQFEPVYSKYDVWPWDPAWPSDFAGFTAKLKDRDFIDEKYWYDVTVTSHTDDAWEYRGSEVFTGNNERKPTFLLVRTIGGKRFLCKGRSVKDPGAIDAAVASCRGAKL